MHFHRVILKIYILFQVDGNTDEKGVQEKFIVTLMETMKGDNFPSEQPDVDDGTVLQDIDGLHTPAATNKTVAGPAVPHQNGYLPNNTINDNSNNREQPLRYDVRNMYAQIGSYPNDSVL